MLIKYVIFFPDGKKRTRKNVSNVKKATVYWSFYMLLKQPRLMNREQMVDIAPTHGSSNAITF